MAREADPLKMVGRDPDERLLGEDLDQLPEALGTPEAPPPSRVRGRIVAVGATLTGVTLVAGLALIVLGAVEAFSGGLGLGAILALVIGLALVGTHWGWVHVAEATAEGLDGRRNRDVDERRREWLAEIEPYTRWSVATSAESDGSIAIVTVRHVPVTSGERGFTFVREIAEREVHAEDESAATVAERAELLRRHAAALTAREQARYEVANDAFQRTLLDHADEQQRLAAVRAASEALSQQINSNLREPPLME
ncbi:MAG TPA: hypothetical protein VG325_07205 [Solirubrobacteraceae bacterium]|jgi:hypothetical protein|nr:hypothetical protein [Solirubrobacteraceae bacterium]